MNTTMPTRKVNKFKIIGLTSVVALAFASGGYALADNNADNKATAQQTSSTTQSTNTTNVDDPAFKNPTTVEVYSALNNYMYEKGIPAGAYKIKNLQIEQGSARGKVVTGDSGSVFYAKIAQGGEWTVVFAGQNTVDVATASQYGLPQKWVGQTNWYN